MELKFNVIETLNYIAQNEHDNYITFRERFIDDCKNEDAIFDLLRLLKGIEDELHDCLKGRIHISVDRNITVKVMKTIRTELDIIRYRMRFPGLDNSPMLKSPKPVGLWTDDKICLIELIYAISHSGSINKGSITLKAIQDCFECIFLVKLGNISKRIDELMIRREKKGYLETLITNLDSFLYDRNA